MRLGTWSWFQFCAFLAIVCTAWLSVYRPSTSHLQTKPIWMVENSNDSFQDILIALREPAPTIKSTMTVVEAMQVVSSYCPTRVHIDSPKEANISEKELFDWPRSHFNQSLQTWLESNLSRLDLTFTIYDGELVIMERNNENCRMTRSYPCPAVDSFYLEKAMEATGSNWELAGGNDSIVFIDTDSQTLILVTTDYSTLRKLEKIIGELNKCAGIGWRTGGPTWTRLPRAILGRLTDWIEPKSQSPIPPATPVPGIGRNAGCVF